MERKDDTGKREHALSGGGGGRINTHALPCQAFAILIAPVGGSQLFWPSRASSPRKPRAASRKALGETRREILVPEGVSHEPGGTLRARARAS